MNKLFFAVVLMIFTFNVQNAQGDTIVGTKILTLSNVPYSCINVKKQLVDFWILSSRVSKNNTFWTSTKGVGARVDVQLSSATEGMSHFPVAAAINTTDLDGKIIRAELSLHVLDQGDLWNDRPEVNTKTKSLSVPVNFVRRQGSSDTVKVMQALISFTNSTSASVPPNPYAKGTQLFGQFFNSLNTVFQPNPNEILDPSFQLGFGLHRENTGCNDMELRDGIGAQIADYNGSSTEADGIIKTQNIANYCFYKLGDNRDPDIGFATKSGGTCPSVIPLNVKVLNNPQFIWMAYGTCKDDQTCGSAPALTINKIGLLKGTSSSLSKILMVRMNNKSKQSDIAKVQAAIQDDNPEALKGIGTSTARFVHGLSRCNSVGITAERCFDSHLSAQKNIDD